MTSRPATSVGTGGRCARESVGEGEERGEEREGGRGMEGGRGGGK